MTKVSQPHENQHEPKHRHPEREHDLHRNPHDLPDYLQRLEGSEREAWQKPDEVVSELGLRPGNVAAEAGAGPGYFSLRLARAVGPEGHVFAADVEPRMLEALCERLVAARIGNVTPVLSLAGDPLLPPSSCDLALIVNSFHHFPDGKGYLRRLQRALKPGGRIVNIDFFEGELAVGPSPEHKLSRDAFLRMATEAGLALESEKTFLPYQYFLILRPR